MHWHCFYEFLRSSLGDRLTTDARSLFDLLSEAIIFEFPYAPEGFVQRLTGKIAIRDHMQNLSQWLHFE